MRDCRCGKRMLMAANEGTCVWCGYGDVEIVLARAQPMPEPRLPRDLGGLVREGRRADLRCENVVRLDRLRDQPADRELAA